MRPGSDVVARFEVRDFADELDQFFKFIKVLRKCVSAANETIQLKSKCADLNLSFKVCKF